MSMNQATAATNKGTLPPRRGRGRPKKQLPQPNSKGLPSLPPELIGRIATFLLPPPTSPETGFAPPTEHAYGSKKGITQQNKLSRYGGIPSGVRDVLRLAQTCKACDAGVDAVVGKIGDGSTEDKKRTLYISLPEDPNLHAWRSVKQSHIELNTRVGRLMKNVRASCETLEQLIILDCEHHGSKARDRDRALCSLLPFQKTSTSFPKLRHLQLGPEVCHICSSAIMSLFCATKFCLNRGRMLPEVDVEDDASSNSDHGVNRPVSYNHEDIPGIRGQESQEFDEPAAANLDSLQLISTRPEWRYASQDKDDFRDPLQILKHRVAKQQQIQMLQIWLPHIHEPWGGMGRNGTVTFISPKDAKSVEFELTEWAKQELDKSRSAQDRLLERSKAQAKALLPLQKRKRPMTSGSIETELEYEDQGSMTTDAKKHKSLEGDDEAQVKIENDPNPATTSHANSVSTSGSNEQPSDDHNSSLRHAARQHQNYVRYNKQFLDFIASNMPELVGLSIQHRGNTRLDLTESRGDLDEFAIHFVQPLAKLDKLRYLDFGLAGSGRSEVSNFPLGLSLSTTRNGRGKAKELDPALQAMKRRKYTIDMMKAKAEGDQWRKTVLERCFGLPSSGTSLGASDTATPSSSTNPSASVASGDIDGADEDKNVHKMSWPASLRSGYFVAPDLENRVRYRGIMIPWKIKDGKVVLEPPVKMRL